VSASKAPTGQHDQEFGGKKLNCIFMQVNSVGTFGGKVSPKIY